MRIPFLPARRRILQQGSRARGKICGGVCARISGFAMATKKNARAAALLAGLAMLAAGCGSGGGSGELGRLRRENDELGSRVEQLEQEARQLRGQPPTPDKVYAFFANDPREGSLAGLFPGDYLESARSRPGGETRERSWTSEGRFFFQ